MWETLFQAVQEGRWGGGRGPGGDREGYKPMRTGTPGLKYKTARRVG